MNPRKVMPVLLCITFLMLFAAGCGAPGASPTGMPAGTFSPPAPTDIPAGATALPAGPASIPGQTLMIYDDDGSRDGIAALLYLLDQPDISIPVVSISYGEAHPAVYVQHVGRVLDELGIQGILLGEGQDAPLAGGTPFPDWLRQMSDDFWGYPLADTGKTYPVQDAAGLMVATINQASQPVTIFQSGTFTTLAQALRLDPGIRENIAAVYFMGGAVYVPGNITNLLPDSSNHVAEWNIYADPQAAKEVFESGLDLYMVPLDATNPLKLTRSDILLWQSGDKKARLVADLYDMMFTSFGFSTVEIFDLTAAVLSVKPDLCPFQPLHLDVVTAGGDTTGQTAVVSGGEPNVNVCLEPDIERIKQEQNRTFSGVGASQEVPSPAPIFGKWEGTASNNGVEMQVSVTIEETCQLDQVCGRYDIPDFSCSGSWTWVGMDGDMYQFQAFDKTSGCGAGTDYLLPQPDGTVIYISRGDYGETQGPLHRVP